MRNRQQSTPFALRVKLHAEVGSLLQLAICPRHSEKSARHVGVRKIEIQCTRLWRLGSMCTLDLQQRQARCEREQLGPHLLFS